VKTTSIAIGLVLIAGIAALDYATGYEISFSVFYLFPILFVAWRLGLAAGLAFSLLGGVVWLVVDQLSGTPYATPVYAYWNAFVRTSLFVIVVYLAANWQRLHRGLENLVEERTAELSALVEKLEAEVRERERSEERFVKIFRSSPDPVAISRLADGEIVEVNPAWERLSGYERKEVIGKKAEEAGLWFDPEARSLLLAQLRDAGRVVDTEFRFRTKSGEVLEGLVSAEVMRLSDEPCLLLVGKDITERKKMEKALRELPAHILKTQDTERRRLARELHDSTSQNLTALALNLAILDGAVQGSGERARKALAESQTLVSGTSKEIRTLSYLLHPPLLEEVGLAAAARWYVEGFAQRGGLKVDLNVASDLGRLGNEAELTLYRILQEGLTNIHRHSGSSKASIRLSRDSGEVVLEMVDEGRGMPAEVLDKLRRAIPPLGVGIAGMRERLRQLGGTLEIESGSGGSTVRARIPIKGDVQ